MKNLLFALLLLPVFGHAQVRNVVAKYPLDGPSTKDLDDRIIGKWKFKEDTNKNNFYEVLRHKPYDMDRYHLKFWDRGGTNPTWEANLHFSKMGEVTFINVPYFESHNHRFTHEGFFFLKILDANADFTQFTAALVNDPTLWGRDSLDVRNRIDDRINDPKYYKDTVHFYKVK